MNPKPVLRAIQSLLEFKNDTTIAEIAGIAALPKAKVLDVVNDNREHLSIDRKTGKISAVTLKQNYRIKQYAEGKTYQVTPENYGADNRLQFAGHDTFKETHLEEVVIGGFGDSFRTKYVRATPENIAALEAEDCRHINSICYDLACDSLWKEVNEKELTKIG